MNRHPRTFRRALGALLASSLIATLAACAGSGKAAVSADGAAIVRINQAFQSLLYLPLYVAQEKGYFAEEGVEVKISTGGGGAQSWAAVLGGSADFSIQDPIFVPKSRENGGPGVVVAGIQNAPTVFIVGKDATNLQEDLSFLEGKRIVTSPEPDTTWAFMTYLIKQNNLKDVELVNVALGNELAAVASGKADYALALEPQVEQSVLDEGFHVAYSFSANEDWYPFAFSSLTSTQKYLDANPDAAQGVVTALQKASQYIYSDFDGTVAVAATYFPDLSREVLAAAVKREIDAEGYPEDVLVTKDAWDINLEISTFVGNIKKYPSDATSYENNVNTELAAEAKRTASEG